MRNILNMYVNNFLADGENHDSILHTYRDTIQDSAIKATWLDESGMNTSLIEKNVSHRINA